MASNGEIYEAFIEGRLGKDEWTHEAHLITSWTALQTRTPGEALAHLRESITAHNCGVGTQNTAYSGYHETLTVYYVTAVDSVGAATPEELFEHPDTDRGAPLRFWTKDLLMSSQARLQWVEPDLGPLPWARADDAVA